MTAVLRLCTLPDDTRTLAREVFIALDIHHRGVLRPACLLSLLTTVHGEDSVSAADSGLPRPPTGPQDLVAVFDVAGSGGLDFAAFLALCATHPVVLHPLLRLRQRARAATLGTSPCAECHHVAPALSSLSLHRPQPL
jgi:hypothetical protein